MVTATVRVLKLFPNEDSKELFSRLMAEAENGDLAGAIVISICRRREGINRHFHLSLSGLASTDPVVAAGAFSACQVLIQELALQDSGP